MVNNIEVIYIIFMCVMEYVNEWVNKIVGYVGWLVVVVIVLKDINVNF